MCASALPAPPSTPPTSAALSASHGSWTMSKHAVAADNDCLFTAVSFLACNSEASAADIRALCADLVRRNPTTFTPAVLDGRTASEYAAYITGPDHRWGGGIELSVLAPHFGVQFVAIDIITVKAFTFGAASAPKSFLLYSGTHYDALVGRPVPSDPSVVVKVFDPTDDGATHAALAVAQAAHKRGAFTDTANFTLLCLDCHLGVVGSEGAMEHAKTTGHQKFGEYRR